MEIFRKIFSAIKASIIPKPYIKSSEILEECLEPTLIYILSLPDPQKLILMYLSTKDLEKLSLACYSISVMPIMREINGEIRNLSDIIRIPRFKNITKINITANCAIDLSTLWALKDINITYGKNIKSNNTLLILNSDACNLHTLSLTGCQIFKTRTNGIDITGSSAILNNLRNLSMNRCTLGTLRGLSKLQKLCINNSATLDNISYLNNLTELLLDTVSIDTISYLPNLRNLSITRVSISTISYLPNLRDLTIIHVPNINIPKTLTKLCNLTIIHVPNINIPKTLTNLRKLHIDHCCTRITIPSTLSKLSFLYIYNTTVTLLPKMYDLDHIRASNSHIDGIHNITELYSLIISKCVLTDINFTDPISMFTIFSKLRMLRVNGVNISWRRRFKPKKNSELGN